MLAGGDHRTGPRLGAPFYNPSPSFAYGAPDPNPPLWKAGATSRELEPPRLDTDRGIWTVYDPQDDELYYTDLDLRTTRAADLGRVPWMRFRWRYPFRRLGKWYRYLGARDPLNEDKMVHKELAVKLHEARPPFHPYPRVTMSDMGREFFYEIVDPRDPAVVLHVSQPMPKNLGMNQVVSIASVWEPDAEDRFHTPDAWIPHGRVRYIPDPRGAFYYFFDDLDNCTMWLPQGAPRWDSRGYSPQAHLPAVEYLPVVRKNEKGEDVTTQEPAFKPPLVARGSPPRLYWLDPATGAEYRWREKSREFVRVEQFPSIQRGEWAMGSGAPARVALHGDGDHYYHWADEAAGKTWRCSKEAVVAGRVEWVEEFSLLQRALRDHERWLKRRDWMGGAVTEARRALAAGLQQAGGPGVRRVKSDMGLSLMGKWHGVLLFPLPAATMRALFGAQEAGAEVTVAVWAGRADQYSFFAAVRDAVCAGASRGPEDVCNVYFFVQAWVRHLRHMPDDAVARLQQARIPINVPGFRLEGTSDTMGAVNCEDLGAVLALALHRCACDGRTTELEPLLGVLGVIGYPMDAVFDGLPEGQSVPLNIGVFRETGPGGAGLQAVRPFDDRTGCIFVPLLELRTYRVENVTELGRVIRSDMVHDFTVHHLLVTEEQHPRLPLWGRLRSLIHHDTLDAFPASVPGLDELEQGAEQDEAGPAPQDVVSDAAIYVEDGRRCRIAPELQRGGALPPPPPHAAMQALSGPGVRRATLGQFLSLVRAHGPALGADGAEGGDWSDEEDDDLPLEEARKAVNALLAGQAAEASDSERALLLPLSEKDLRLLIAAAGLGPQADALLLAHRARPRQNRAAGAAMDALVAAVTGAVRDWALGCVRALSRALFPDEAKADGAAGGAAGGAVGGAGAGRGAGRGG